MERAVPSRFGSLDERIRLPDRQRASFAFQLTRSPFEVSLVGNVARLEATVGYALRAWYNPPVLPEVSGSCGTGGSAGPRLRLLIEAPITVRDDWRLATRSRIATLDPASTASRDRCRMTFLDLDMTDRIIGAARSFLEDHTADIDSVAASVDLRSRIVEWWTKLQDPIRLTDSLWLVFRPETIMSGPAHGLGDSLEIALAMRARPGIIMGRRPPFAPAALPSLDTGNVSPGLELVVDALADYQAVSAFLHPRWGIRRFDARDGPCAWIPCAFSESEVDAWRSKS